MTNLHINAARLLHELHHLATLTDCPPTTDPTLPTPTTAVTRIVFTPRDLEARAYIASLAEAAGFHVPCRRHRQHLHPLPRLRPHPPRRRHRLPYRRDPPRRHVRRHRRRPRRPGSHALPERIRLRPATLPSKPSCSPARSPPASALAASAPASSAAPSIPPPPTALPDLIAETNLGSPSSPTASSSAKVGSQNLPSTLHEILTLKDVRTAAGFTGSLDTVKLPPNYYHAWVELHIEQGPLLERERIPIGIVTNIAAPRQLPLRDHRLRRPRRGPPHARSPRRPLRRRRAHPLPLNATPSPPTPPPTPSTP